MRGIPTRGKCGFTLVELLVVIAIIALLAAFLVPAVYISVQRAKVARIGIEVANITKALERYKLEYGEYPPDFSGSAILPANGTLNAGSRAAAAVAIINNHLQNTKRRRSPFDLPRRDDGNIHVEFLESLSPRNALIFWLGGFTSGPVTPLFGASERSPLFEFDKARLIPGSLQRSAFTVAMIGSNPPANDTLGGEIGFVIGYYPSGDALQSPYIYYRAAQTSGVYAAASDGLAYLDDLQWAIMEGVDELGHAAAPLPMVSSLQQVPDPTNLTGPPTVPAFVAPQKFQLISAGLDSDYGPFSGASFSPVFDSNGDFLPANVSTNSVLLPAFPSGENCLKGHQDNLGNFTEGQTVEDRKPE